MSRSIQKDQPYKGLFLVILGIISLLGIWGLIMRFAQGEISNITNVVPWGLWVSGYIFFIGLASGASIFSAVIHIFNLKQFEKIGRIAILQAFICLVGSLFLIFLDLGHPFRSIGIVLWFNPRSVMAWMFIGYFLYFVIVIGELYIVRNIDRLSGVAKERAKANLRILGISSLPVVIFVTAGVGAIFATAKANPVWATGLLPILFIILALVSGIALLTIIFHFQYKPRTPDESVEKEKLIQRLGTLLGTLLVVQTLILASDYLVVLYGAVPQHANPYRIILGGPYALLFWFGVVLLGFLFPFYIFVRNKNNSRGSVRMVVLACAGIIVSMLVLRYIIIIPPLLIPNFKTLSQAYPHAKYAAQYIPNYKEWFVILAAVAVSGWLFEIGRRVLKLQEPLSVE